MRRFDCTTLKRGDIVLAEFLVTRWAVKELNEGTGEGPSKPGKGRQWRKWNVEFKLDALSLMSRGSEYYIEPQRADEQFKA